MGVLGLLFLAVIGMFYVRRAWWGWKTRAQKRTRGRYRGGAALGNALQTLQIFVHPHVEHVIEERLKEPADEDDEGEPKDPKAHLLRQVKKIRNGEDVDRLTAMLPR
jgi:hypothetical protein